METFAEFIGNLVDLLALVHLDRLFGRVEHDAAVLASRRVGANLIEQLGAEFLVEVIG
jgi:hypothetical protein